ncbi:hypothetical protein DSO57_1017392 [Entomophthora muscae]|uniref:Uncharacterized protein n=1 Tax=Entomophthora muscae TaxID=34485 RepID=A0ACC2STN5_9FUNG|nr:hypothetical protein DSO57_1017392 [Entomophthora muscae]
MLFTDLVDHRYRVEVILGSKLSLNSHYYQVKWKNLTIKDGAWDPKEDCTSYPVLVKELWGGRAFSLEEEDKKDPTNTVRSQKPSIE